MANLVSLTMAVLAVVPAGAIFFLAYGRYDGTFRDNVVFLYFMGGLFIGSVVGAFTIFALGLAVAVVGVLLLALLYPIALVAGINRRKWQGDRHAIFNGGAMGLGTALMLSFTLLFVVYDEVTWPNAVQALVLSLGIATLLFGLGLLAGNAVRLKRPFRVALLGTAIVLAPVIFLVSFVADRTWLWVVLLAAYGTIVAVAAERKLLIEGVAPEMRKQMRRRKRAKDAA